MMRYSLWMVPFGILSQASAQTQPFKIVLDPGHGGNDEGTIYLDGRNRILEKDLTLKLSQQVARQLQSRGHQVILTRTGDQEVSLPHRTALANRLQADAFISIHLNSGRPSSKEKLTDADGPEGIETYILNQTTDASSKRLAQLENSPIHSYGNLDIALILKDLRLDANRLLSKNLACSLQTQLTRTTQQKNRGIKEALFYVLLGADMPSVLLEAGFLSHPFDRNYILSSQGSFLMSLAIADGIERFQNWNTHSKRNFLYNCKAN